MFGKLSSMWKRARRDPAKPSRTRRPRSRLNVELLEDRLSPAVFNWVGGSFTNPTDWFTPGNWQVMGKADGPLPGPNDAVEISGAYGGRDTEISAAAPVVVRSLDLYYFGALTLQANANLTVNTYFDESSTLVVDPNASLQVNGNWSVAGYNGFASVTINGSMTVLGQQGSTVSGSTILNVGSTGVLQTPNGPLTIGGEYITIAGLATAPIYLQEGGNVQVPGEIDAGAVKVTGGDVMFQQDFTFNVGSSYEQDGGEVDLGHSWHAPNSVLVTGGLLAVAGGSAVTVGDDSGLVPGYTFTWTGGTLVGEFDILAPATLHITDPPGAHTTKFLGTATAPGTIVDFSDDVTFDGGTLDLANPASEFNNIGLFYLANADAPPPPLSGRDGCGTTSPAPSS